MSGFDLNKAMLIGNVGKNPEVREYGDGKKLCKFTLATNESWKNKQTGEYETETSWHNIVCFNDFLCGFIERNVAVGTKLYIEGTIKTRHYTKEDTGDVKHYITEIVIPMFGGDVKVLARGGDIQDPDNEPGNSVVKDDIPF